MGLSQVESLAVGHTVAESVGVDAERLAAAMLAPEVQDALALAIVGAFSQAWAAWSEREDIFAWPGSVHTASRVCIDAVAAAFGAPLPTASLTPTWPGADVSDMRVQLERIRYRDWRFSLEDDGEWVEVVVTADVDDCHKPGQRFTLSRSALVRNGDVVDAALRAVLRVHEHEVLEHLQVGDRAPLDPHRVRDGFVGPQPLD